MPQQPQGGPPGPPPAQWGSQGFFPASTVSSPWGQPGPYVPPAAPQDLGGVPTSYDPTALYGQEPPGPAGGSPYQQQGAGSSIYQQQGQQGMTAAQRNWLAQQSPATLGALGLSAESLAPLGLGWPSAPGRETEQPERGAGSPSAGPSRARQEREQAEQTTRDEAASLWEWLLRGPATATPQPPPPATGRRGGGGGGGGGGNERQARIAALMARLAAGEPDIYRRAAATGVYRGGMVPVRLGAQWRAAEPTLRQWEMTAPT